KKIDAGEKTLLRKVVDSEGARLKGSQLKEALEQGDALTKHAVARSAKAVGMVIANTFNVLSPDVFVLGGGVGTDLGDGYLAEVRKWAKDFAFTTELGSVEVVPAALGDDAGILGAAIFARE